MAKKSSKLKDILNEELGGIVFPESVGSPFKGAKDRASLLKMANILSLPAIRCTPSLLGMNLVFFAICGSVELEHFLAQTGGGRNKKMAHGSVYAGSAKKTPVGQ